MKRSNETTQNRALYTHMLLHSQPGTLQCRIADPGRPLFFRDKITGGRSYLGGVAYFFLDKNLRGRLAVAFSKLFLLIFAKI